MKFFSYFSEEGTGSKGKINANTKCKRNIEVKKQGIAQDNQSMASLEEFI